MVSKSTLEHYYNATTRARQDGIAWYSLARLWCERAARRHKRPLKTVAAIVAVLSQRVNWRRNLELAETALTGGTPNHLRTVQDKVQRLIEGELPTRILSGPKIVEFYRAILGDTDAIVTDSWMLQLLQHHRPSATINQHKRLWSIIERDAALVGAPPAIYQAIVWCTARGKSF